MLDKLVFFGEGQILVERADDERRRGSIEGGTEQPQESRRRDQHQPLILVLDPPLIEPLREFPRKVCDRSLVRAFASTHGGPPRVAAILAEGSTRTIAHDLAIARSALWVLDLFDERDALARAVIVEDARPRFVRDQYPCGCHGQVRPSARQDAGNVGSGWSSTICLVPSRAITSMLESWPPSSLT